MYLLEILLLLFLRRFSRRYTSILPLPWERRNGACSRLIAREGDPELDVQ